MGEAGHVCRKLAFGESETQMLSMDNLFKGRHFDREIITLCDCLTSMTHRRTPFKVNVTVPSP